MSLRVVQTAALLAATITTGLMAGLFAGFAYSVMPGLGRSSSRTLIEAMQTSTRRSSTAGSCFWGRSPSSSSR